MNAELIDFFFVIVLNIFLVCPDVGGSATTGSIVGGEKTLKGIGNVEMRRNLWREGVVHPSSTFNHEAEKEDLLNAAKKLRYLKFFLQIMSLY